MQATTVAALGKAEAPYTVANFRVRLSAKAGTVPTAKAKLKNQVEDLNKALEDLRTAVGFEYVKNSVHTSSSVHEQYEYHSHRNDWLVGYQVSYSLSFQTEDLDKVNDIYEALTSLPEAQVANPGFGLKPAQRERLQKKALKNAFAKASDRFETECKVLGLNASDFEVCNWEVTYSDSQRGNRVAGVMAARSVMNSVSDDVYEGAPIAAAMGGGPSSEPLNLVVGLAEVTVNLEVGYARKVVTQQSVKAKVVKGSAVVSEHV